jgi:hypothetical protein
MDSVIAWILSFIVMVAPPGRTVYYPAAQETKEEAVVRYNSIAQDVLEVVYDPGTKPLFRGPNGRAQTVALVLSIMLHESGFRKDVDFALGKYSRGDQGNSWCLMQHNIGTGRTLPWNTKHNRAPKWGDPPEEIHPGYTGPELIADRKLCISEGVKVLRLSMGVCRKLPLDQRLRSYASGTCEKGGKQSAVRMGTALRWFYRSRSKRNFVDSEVTAAVAQLLKESAEQEAMEAEKQREKADQAAAGPIAQR